MSDIPTTEDYPTKANRTSAQIAYERLKEMGTDDLNELAKLLEANEPYQGCRLYHHLGQALKGYLRNG